MQIVGAAHGLQFPGDAFAADGVVALGERPDDRRLVGEVLVERTERDVRPLDDVAHAEPVAALLDEERLGTGEDSLEALAAAPLRRREPRDRRRGWCLAILFRLRSRHRGNSLTPGMREFIV